MLDFCLLGQLAKAGLGALFGSGTNYWFAPEIIGLCSYPVPVSSD
jgi:hypothetical protein